MKQKWLEFARRAGDFQVGVIFKILYFLIIVPVGFVSSIFTDFLDTKAFPKWSEVEIKDSLKTLKEE